MSFATLMTFVFFRKDFLFNEIWNAWKFLEVVRLIEKVCGSDFYNRSYDEAHDAARHYLARYAKRIKRLQQENSLHAPFVRDDFLRIHRQFLLSLRVPRELSYWFNQD
jgi:hypothetical protein